MHSTTNSVWYEKKKVTSIKSLDERYKVVQWYPKNVVVPFPLPYKL